MLIKRHQQQIKILGALHTICYMQILTVPCEKQHSKEENHA